MARARWALRRSLGVGGAAELTKVGHPAFRAFDRPARSESVSASARPQAWEGPDSSSTARGETVPGCGLLLRELPARGTAGLDGGEGGRRAGHEAVDVPGWSAGGGGAELGGDGLAGVVDLGRPAVGRRPLGDVGHLAGSVTLRALPSTTRSNSWLARLRVQRGSRARLRPLQVPSPVTNQNAPSVHAAPTRVTCGLPSGLIVASQAVCRLGPPVSGAWANPWSRRASIGASPAAAGRRYPPCSSLPCSFASSYDLSG